MNDALLISSVVSWVFLLGLAVVVYALARQIGVLHERIKPVGALSLGKVIKPGEAAPSFTLPNLNGGAVTLGGTGAARQATLLFFLSPTCPVCKTLLPVLKSAQAAEHRWLRIVLASDGDAVEHVAFIERHGLREFPYVLSAQVGMAYQIGKLPYGVLIDEHGRVASHGLVNNREHLDSLFEANVLGLASTHDDAGAQARA
jgi:methylamine dehydrogenase accessory protein MauD